MNIISKIEESKKWKKIDAVVFDSRFTGKGKNIKIHFYAEYSYAGINYGTKNISFKEKKGKLEKNLVSKMNPGDKIKIYIDPKLPYRSVYLNPIENSYFFDWIKMMFGFVFSFYIIYLMVF